MTGEKIKIHEKLDKEIRFDEISGQLSLSPQKLL